MVEKSQWAQRLMKFHHSPNLLDSAGFLNPDNNIRSQDDRQGVTPASHTERAQSAQLKLAKCGNIVRISPGDEQRMSFGTALPASLLQCHNISFDVMEGELAAEFLPLCSLLELVPLPQTC